MSDIDFSALTPEHRVVYKYEDRPEVEMGLHLSDNGNLLNDLGHAVRYDNGTLSYDAEKIIRVIEPPTPQIKDIAKRGMVVQHPTNDYYVAWCDGEDWLGALPDDGCHWWDTYEIQYMIDNQGWVIKERGYDS